MTINLDLVRKELAWCAAKHRSWFERRDRRNYSTFSRSGKFQFNKETE